MSSSKRITSELKTAWKIVGYLGLLFLAGVSIYMLYLVGSDFNSNSEDFLFLGIFLFILVASVISAFYLHNTLLVIDETGLTNEGLFSTYTLSYPEIEKIKFDSMLILIQGGGNTISIGNLSTNFEEATAFIANQLEGREDISYEGKEKFLNRHFEENELYR